MSFKVAAQGNTIKTSEYLYEDREVKAFQEYYYRLKMVDKDGTFTYSPIRNINIGGKQTFFISRGPNNPVQNGFASMEIVSIDQQDLKIQLFDRSGKLIQQYQPNLLEGENSIELNVSNVPAGGYLLSLSDGRHQEGIQLIIAN